MIHIAPMYNLYHTQHVCHMELTEPFLNMYCFVMYCQCAYGILYVCDFRCFSSSNKCLQSISKSRPVKTHLRAHNSHICNRQESRSWSHMEQIQRPITNTCKHNITMSKSLETVKTTIAHLWKIKKYPMH